METEQSWQEKEARRRRLSEKMGAALMAGSLAWNEYLVTIINMLLNFSTEFLYQRFFVFGKSLDSAKQA